MKDFLREASRPSPVVKSLRARTDLYLDCHLMVSNPGDLLDAFADAGADGSRTRTPIAASPPLADGAASTLRALRRPAR